MKLNYDNPLNALGPVVGSWKGDVAMNHANPSEGATASKVGLTSVLKGSEFKHQFAHDSINSAGKHVF